MEVLLAGSPPEHQERGHVGRRADREGRKDDVDRDTLTQELHIQFMRERLAEAGKFAKKGASHGI